MEDCPLHPFSLLESAKNGAKFHGPVSPPLEHDITAWLSYGAWLLLRVRDWLMRENSLPLFIKLTFDDEHESFFTPFVLLSTSSSLGPHIGTASTASYLLNVLKNNGFPILTFFKSLIDLESREVGRFTIFLTGGNWTEWRFDNFQITSSLTVYRISNCFCITKPRRQR